jgi:hypothetical protein
MSRRAQAEREKEARIILGSSSNKSLRPSSMPPSYTQNHLVLWSYGPMNLVYEATKERG